MALEFNKLVDQVVKMGRMLDELDFDLGSRLEIARQRFFAADDLDFIHQRIALARGPEISGYRGAAPLDPPYHEVICQMFPPPPEPASATIIAADGSQIYPSEHFPVHYFVINTGLFVFHHGSGERLPEPISIPRLYFHKDHVHDKGGRIIGSRTVDARRTVREMQELGKLAWELRGEARPLLALYDNHLLFWAGSDVLGSVELLKRYQGALVRLHDAGAALAGYVDNPTRSRVVLRLLHLLSLSDDDLRQQRDVGTAGLLEGLRDIHLFNSLLKPGWRSALMVQNSPHNFGYRKRGVSYEIAFFYLKVATAYRESLVRVDVPMWVAREPQMVNDLHALLLAQCGLQGRNPYPYALTRADELAYVSAKDKAKLEEMIGLELRRRGVDPHVFNAKAWGKALARSVRRGFEL